MDNFLRGDLPEDFTVRREFRPEPGSSFAPPPSDERQARAVRAEDVENYTIFDLEDPLKFIAYADQMGAPASLIAKIKGGIRESILSLPNFRPFPVKEEVSWLASTLRRFGEIE